MKAPAASVMACAQHPGTDPDSSVEAVTWMSLRPVPLAPTIRPDTATPRITFTTTPASPGACFPSAHAGA